MDVLTPLELSHIVHTLGHESDDVGEFRESLHAFHEFVSDLHHPETANVVLETGAAMIRAAMRAAVASAARGLSERLRPGMRLKVHRVSEDVYLFTVAFPNFKKLSEEDQDVYHRRAFLDVYDLMRTMGDEPPMIIGRLWDGEIEDTVRSAACAQNDEDGSLYFRGDGAVYRTSIRAWRENVPRYLDGVISAKVRLDTSKCRVLARM